MKRIFIAVVAVAAVSCTSPRPNDLVFNRLNGQVRLCYSHSYEAVGSGDKWIVGQPIDLPLGYSMHFRQTGMCESIDVYRSAEHISRTVIDYENGKWAEEVMRLPYKNDELFTVELLADNSSKIHKKYTNKYSPQQTMDVVHYLKDGAMYKTETKYYNDGAIVHQVTEKYTLDASGREALLEIIPSEGDKQELYFKYDEFDSHKNWVRALVSHIRDGEPKAVVERGIYYY